MKFNYAIGRYRDDKLSVSCYYLFGEVHYGTVEDAKDFLEYVRRQSPEKEWKIFNLVEVDNEYN